MSIPPLQRPDLLRVQAAQGWVELGNHGEAQAELDQVSPECRHHPDVLKVRWELHAMRKDWDAALETASELAEAFPHEPAGFLQRAHALHRLNRTAEARDNLRLVLDRFPENLTVRYDLARYESQLGNLEPAGEHLGKAFAISGARELMVQALNDPEFAALWKDHGICRDGSIRARQVDLESRGYRRLK